MELHSTLLLLNADLATMESQLVESRNQRDRLDGQVAVSGVPEQLESVLEQVFHVAVGTAAPQVIAPGGRIDSTC
eukprot:766190-Hanusia_phi.AAC.3